MINRDVANDYVATELKTDRFVTPASFDRIARIGISERSTARIRRGISQGIVLCLRARLVAVTHESFPPDPTRPQDRNVFEILAPDQAVVKMAVTKVLI